MIRITTKVGDLYIESVDDREETDRIKIYDSKLRYLDYLPTESVSPYETLEQYCNKVIRRLEECDTVEEVVKYLDLKIYLTDKDWTKLLDDIYGGEAHKAEDGKWYKGFDQKCLTERNVSDNDYVNIIGSTYVLLAE